MDTRYLNTAIFITLFVSIIYLFSALLSPVLFGLMIAATFKPLKNKYLVGKFRLSNDTAVILGMIFLFLISIPFVLAVINISTEAQEIAQHLIKDNKDLHLKITIENLLKSLSFINPYITVDQLATTLKSFMPKIAESGSHFIGKFLTSIPKLVIGVFFFLVSFYYFSVDGENFKNYLIRNDIFEKSDVEDWSKTLTHAFQSTIFASVATGIVQAFIITVAASICGFDFIFTIFFVTLFLTQIPILGTTPVSLVLITILYFEGSLPLLILMCGAAIIAGASDNIIRAWVLRSYDGLHPLWGLVSTIGGLIAIGPLGVVLGPAVVLFIDIAIKNKKHLKILKVYK